MPEKEEVGCCEALPKLLRTDEDFSFMSKCTNLNFSGRLFAWAGPTAGDGCEAIQKRLG